MAKTTLEGAKRQFKIHYKKAMRLKEGGKAWEREINQARHYLVLGQHLYQEQLMAKYSK